MSLPTKAIFTENGKEVFKGFANIGWFYDEQLIPQLFYDMMCEKQFPKAGTWDQVTVYGKTYEYDHVIKMMEKVNKE